MRELGRHSRDGAGRLSVGSADLASGKCLVLPGDHIIPNNLTMPTGKVLVYVFGRRRDTCFCS